ncbi:family 1 glycosylhydrolase [Ruegeria atlantica]|uniref:family 1 glycosylhydrolase n=1 Tax=Ruegeria atlantica TaxID=81569 RepID=UPI00147E12EE|nr:family 1 glycosylhydrolase [Ruegeria atlantica]
MKYTRSDFPRDFLFGVAASTKQNLDMMREAGVDCFKFPISWGKVLPEGRGEVSQSGLDAYDRLVDALLARGIRPCATLSNGELPPTLGDLGGWRNRDIAGWFADFTEIVMSRIGDRMFSAAPISLPTQVNRLNLGDCRRTTARAMHHLLLAHGRGIDAMRNLGMSNLGVELDLDWLDPANDTSEDNSLLTLVDNRHARLFLSGVFNNTYPINELADLESHLPTGWQEDFGNIGQPVDWCGLTCFSRAQTDLSARVPFLTQMWQEFSRELPIFVTVNEIIGSNHEKVDRLNHHLAATKSALEQGAPVKGYFVGHLSGNVDGAGCGKDRFAPEGLESDLPNPELTATFDTLKTALSGGSVSLPLAQPVGALQKHWDLVADIGGTNTRLGVITDGTLNELRKYPTGSLPELLDAFHTLRDEIGTNPRAVVAAGAGPVNNGTIRLTNAQLDLSEDDIAKATGAQHTFVINDFTAAAWSVAEITSDDVEVLQGAKAPPSGTRLVVGPGTGLGVGALLYSEGRYHTASGEGGHIGLSPRHVDEVEIFKAARHIAPECFFDDTLVLEAEMFLSGTGLPILYQAAGMAAGQSNVPVRSARDILEDARAQADPIAEKAAHMFTTHLGAVMGDLSVVLMPVGGVFLVGGVAEKNRWLFKDAFRDAFNAGGRFSDLRRSMNLYVSEQHEFGIVGANNFCKSALAR